MVSCLYSTYDLSVDALKGGWEFVMSPPNLESRGCYLIPLFEEDEINVPIARRAFRDNSIVSICCLVIIPPFPPPPPPPPLIKVGGGGGGDIGIRLSALMSVAPLSRKYLPDH